jgi:beta-lactamase superfamily II metal-dependent hydrolase
LTVHFRDVGQGDSELIQFNNKNVLIDGGVQDMRPRIESYVRDHGVSSLDLVVATHPHDDHIGGLIIISRDFPTQQVLDNGQPHTSQTYETFLTLIDQKNIPY